MTGQPTPDAVDLLGELTAATAGMSVTEQYVVTSAVAGWMLAAFPGDPVHRAEEWRAAIRAGLAQRAFVFVDLTAVADAVHDPAVDELAQRRAGR